MSEVFQSYEHDFCKSSNQINQTLAQIEHLIQKQDALKELQILVTESENCLQQMDIESTSIAISDSKDLRSKVRKYKQEFETQRRSILKLQNDANDKANKDNVLGGYSDTSMEDYKKEERQIGQNLKLIEAKRVAFETEAVANNIQLQMAQHTSKLTKNVNQSQSSTHYDQSYQGEQTDMLFCDGHCIDWGIDNSLLQIMNNVLETSAILRTESIDLGYRRQQAKIDFLIQQNKQFEESIKVLDHTISSYHDGIPEQSTLRAEINSLTQQLRTAEQERDLAQGQALLNAQVAQQTETFFTELVTDLEERLKELRRIIHDKEYTIQEFERNTPTLDADGILIKCREVVQLSEVSLKYHNEVDNLQLAIQKLNEQLQYQAVFIEDIVKENRTYKFEIQKFRNSIQNRVNYCRVKEQLTGNLLNSTEADLVCPRQIKSSRPSIKQSQNLNDRTRQPSISQKNKGELELERYRKLFEREAANNRLLHQDNQRIVKFNQLLTQTNEKILKQNQAYLDQVDKLKRANKYLEVFWQSFLQSQGKQLMAPEDFVKLTLCYEEEPKHRKSSLDGATFRPNEQLQECKAYLLQLHRDLHTRRKVIAHKCMSEPSRYKVPIVRKRIKVKQSKPRGHDVSVINQQKNQFNDASFLSQNELF